MSMYKTKLIVSSLKTIDLESFGWSTHAKPTKFDCDSGQNNQIIIVDYNGNSLKRQDVQLYDEYKDNYKEAFNATIENFDRKQNQRIMAYN